MNIKKKNEQQRHLFQTLSRKWEAIKGLRVKESNVENFALGNIIQVAVCEINQSCPVTMRDDAKVESL